MTNELKLKMIDEKQSEVYKNFINNLAVYKMRKELKKDLLAVNVEELSEELGKVREEEALLQAIKAEEITEQNKQDAVRVALRKSELIMTIDSAKSLQEEMVATLKTLGEFATSFNELEKLRTDLKNPDELLTNL